MRAISIIALLLAISLSGPADAQIFRGPCHVDALCAGVPRGGGRILACLRTHKAELADECFSALGHFLMNQKGKPDAGPGDKPGDSNSPDSDGPPPDQAPK